MGADAIFAIISIIGAALVVSISMGAGLPTAFAKMGGIIFLSSLGNSFSHH